MVIFRLRSSLEKRIDFFAKVNEAAGLVMGVSALSDMVGSGSSNRGVKRLDKATFFLISALILGKVQQVMMSLRFEHILAFDIVGEL